MRLSRYITFVTRQNVLSLNFRSTPLIAHQIRFAILNHAKEEEEQEKVEAGLISSTGGQSLSSVNDSREEKYKQISKARLSFRQRKNYRSIIVNEGARRHRNNKIFDSSDIYEEIVFAKEDVSNSTTTTKSTDDVSLFQHQQGQNNYEYGLSNDYENIYTHYWHTK